MCSMLIQYHVSHFHLTRLTILCTTPLFCVFWTISLISFAPLSPRGFVIGFLGTQSLMSVRHKARATRAHNKGRLQTRAVHVYTRYDSWKVSL